MYRLRCTVSGGLEDFAEAEVSRTLQTAADDADTTCSSIKVVWHNRGNSGSQLDIVCHQSRDRFLQETIPLVVSKLRYVDHVSMLVLSEEMEMMEANADADADGGGGGGGGACCDGILDIITKSCLHVNQEILEVAVEAWRLWQPKLAMSLGSHDLEGQSELIAFPGAETLEVDAYQNPALTEAFQVNTIYTKPQVAKAVVDSFVDLVHNELEVKDRILWLDAGAGAGALLRELPEKDSIGVDLDPRHERVRQKDFFEVTQEWLVTCRTYQHLCIISNPPFAQGSRGDYSIVGKFLEHSIQLQARFIGLIVPVKFSHAWKSFGLPIQLRYRMNLPKNSFYDPSTADSKHVKCHFLLFDLQPPFHEINTSPSYEDDQPHQIHVVAKRDKGRFPDITTADMTSAVVNGLGRSGVPLGSSKTSSSTLKAKLAQKFELYLELNPKRALSLVNSMSNRVEHHSLGWMSTSVKPPVALAMNSLAHFLPQDADSIRQSQPALIVNTMCGEGTLEYESIDSKNLSSFRIVGDKNPDAVYQVAAQFTLLEQTHLSRMDFVIWDAHHLPLRSGIADAVLADLPFGGSSKKVHQEPSTTNQPASGPSLNYPKVLAETIRVLKPSSGRAIFASPDSKALAYGTRKFVGSLKDLWQTKLNIGGLTGRLSCLMRKDACWKDLNLLVEDANADKSPEIFKIARHACSSFYLNNLLELQMDDKKAHSLVTIVHLRDVYRRAKQDSRHCYRFCFDPIVTNVQAKSLEKVIRVALQKNPISGTQMG